VGQLFRLLGDFVFAVEALASEITAVGALAMIQGMTREEAEFQAPGGLGGELKAA